MLTAEGGAKSCVEDFRLAVWGFLRGSRLFSFLMYFSVCAVPRLSAKHAQELPVSCVVAYNLAVAQVGEGQQQNMLLRH